MIRGSGGFGRSPWELGELMQALWWRQQQSWLWGPAGDRQNAVFLAHESSIPIDCGDIELEMSKVSCSF